MKQTLQVKMGQHLAITPELVQAIRLLQLSSVELSMEVQSLIESNMMLELAEEGGDDFREEGEGDYSAKVREGTSPSGAEGEREGMESVGEAEGGDVAEGIEFSDRESGSEIADIPEELPVDSVWDEIYDGGMGPSSASLGEDGEYDFLSQQKNQEGIHEHLAWQVNLLPLTPTERVIAMAILDAINNDGYLTVSLAEIADSLGNDLGEIDPAEIESVLRRIQHMDPLGIGARDLAECLLIQLRALPADTPWRGKAERLISDHLSLLAAHDFTQLQRKLKLQREELRETIELIQSLNPRPAAHLNAPEVGQYVIPDIIVRRVKDRWEVELNNEAIPPLRLNKRYISILDNNKGNKNVHTLKVQLQEAKMFIKSLQSRGETLLKVATAIVERQRAFLEHGDVAMKPLILQDIAEILGMHESTISRITTRKFMNTPRGIYELKFFFSSHVQSEEEGATSSSIAIRAMIKQFIEAEDPGKPLSDNAIAELLSDKGVKVARRTIAKYREALHIPSSSDRKRLT